MWRPRAMLLPLYAAAGGLAIALPFFRFSLWPLAWVGFIPILVALARSSSRGRAFRLGWVAGLAVNVPAFYWLVGTIHLFGGFPLSVSLFFYGALSLWSAIQFALFGVGFHRTGFGPLALYPPVLWVALEFIYPHLFPWRLANSQFPVPVLIQTGELFGPFGLSFVMVWVSSALCRFILTGAMRPVAWSAIAVAGIVVYGIFRIPAVEETMEESPLVRVGIVQGNLGVREKGDLLFFSSNLETYRSLTTEIAPHADVVIWPESVITEPLPRDLERISPRSQKRLGLLKPLFAGALMYERTTEGETRLYNSIILFGDDGRILGKTDKIVLMPFGEYLPFASIFPSLRELSPQTGDFEAGERVVPLEVPGVARFAPLNCYEDLEASIARDAVRTGGAEILFAVANDAWFQNTVAPFQHEALALWRAVENRRFLLRVTNTGVTDVVDPVGRVRLRLPVFTEASTVAEVRRLDEITPFTRVGNLFAWMVCAIAVLVLYRPYRSISR